LQRSSYITVSNDRFRFKFGFQRFAFGGVFSFTFSRASSVLFSCDRRMCVRYASMKPRARGVLSGKYRGPIGKKVYSTGGRVSYIARACLGPASELDATFLRTQSDLVAGVRLRGGIQSRWSWQGVPNKLRTRSRPIPYRVGHTSSQ